MIYFKVSSVYFYLFLILWDSPHYPVYCTDSGGGTVGVGIFNPQGNVELGYNRVNAQLVFYGCKPFNCVLALNGIPHK